MDRDGKREKTDSLTLPSSSDLRSRQSVRATFKLSERAIDAISIVATHLGIKQKSLFDHLIDDMKALNTIARGLERDRFKQLDRVQKTYVISRRTLGCLEEASRSFDAPRDALVEYSIERLLPVIEQERQKHAKRKKAVDEMRDYLLEGERILKKLKRTLGEDDPVFAKYFVALNGFGNAQIAVESFVEKSKVIEDF